MPVSPPPAPPAIVPNYWSFSTLSFNRSLAYPNNPEYAVVFPNDLHVYDINGDGHLDILQVYAYIPGRDLPGIPIRVLLGDGLGNFTDGTATLFPNGAPLGDAATGSTVADFNGDGVLDIFISMTWETPNPIVRNNILLLSNGTGGIVDASSTLPDLVEYSHWSSGADIDGDGDVDLYVGNLGSGHPTDPNGANSYFLINDGTGRFVRSDTRLPATIENGFRTYTSSLLFDADNDGDPDLLLGMWGPQAAFLQNGALTSLILFNNGTGTFAETANSILPTPLFSANRAVMLDMVAIDLNGDGFGDLLMLMNEFNQSAPPYGQYGVQVLINNGNGTFRDETLSRLSASWNATWPTGEAVNSRYMHLTDINADGALDLVIQTGGPNRFFLNDGSGHFIGLPSDFLYTNSPVNYAFVPGDFNEDGRTDFFVRTIISQVEEDLNNITEFGRIALWNQPTGTVLTGNEAANAVLGTTLAETLSGLGGNDVLSGGSGGDSLSGGAGVDTLIGGAGADLFIDTAAGLSGDTIRDLRAEDRIIITNATLSGFTFNLTGSVLTFTGGSLTLTGGFSGTLVASAAIGGGVQLSVQALVAIIDVRNDFNGDGRSDIVWRNANGDVTNWLGTATGGFAGNASNSYNNPGSGWTIVGTGDFNGDSRDDVLWRNTNGDVTNWLGTATGNFAGNAANSYNNPGTGWSVAGTGDFNGDGRDDILWRNGNGDVTSWLGQTNGNFAGSAAFNNPGAGWSIAGTGDFNGDGRDDILWRNTNGDVTSWLGQANGNFAGSATFNNPGAGWNVLGTGDFNGDGRDDILWRNANGDVTNWLGTANGGFTGNAANSYNNPGAGWSIAGTGDFNGDGRDDILWRNTNGDVTNWLGQANGNFAGNAANSYNNPGTGWTVQAEPML